MLDDMIKAIRWYDLVALAVIGIAGNTAMLFVYVIIHRAAMIEKEKTNDT